MTAILAILLTQDIQTAAMSAVESLLDARLVESDFGTTGGGRRVDHFTTKTRPTLARASEVIGRISRAVARDFPQATVDDASDLADVIALRSAIELEGGAFPEQVESGRSPARLYMDMLKDLQDRLTRRFEERWNADAEDGGDAGLDAKWNFPVEVGRAPGSECPIDCRPTLRW